LKDNRPVFIKDATEEAFGEAIHPGFLYDP
jgi:hypothetical protein